LANIDKLFISNKTKGSPYYALQNAVVGEINGLGRVYMVAADGTGRIIIPDKENNPNLLVVGDYLTDTTVNGSLLSAKIVAKQIIE